MSQDIYAESRHIGYAVLWGLKLACFYDVFLIFRNVIKHKNFYVCFEDFLYWLFCAFFVFNSLYEAYFIGFHLIVLENDDLTYYIIF